MGSQISTKWSLRNLITKSAFFKSLYQYLNMQIERDIFIEDNIKNITPGAILLDAGCGSQRYRALCAHLEYRGQDFGAYHVDEKGVIGSSGVGGSTGYAYGDLYYKGDIWKVQECDGVIDVVLCTEVFEHIPYPIETIKEFSRLLKVGGQLILTAPSNCLRHMDPYFYYSGYSDRWYEAILPQYGFEIKSIEPVGDYYRWMAVELARTAEAHSFVSKIFVLPAFMYFFFKRKTDASVNTLCGGYHVVAQKVR